MKQKVCKNKNCQKPLPEGYKYKHCESCRNKKVKQIKNIGEATMGFAVIAGRAVLKKIRKS